MEEQAMKITIVGTLMILAAIALAAWIVSSLLGKGGSDAEQAVS